MHDRKILARLNNRAVELSERRRQEAVQLAYSKAFDLWPGDRPDFDGSVRHGDWKADATPEYAGSRVPSAVNQLDGRPITIPSDRPVTIRLVDVKIRESHP
jgi:hypothetical protein